MVSLMFTFQLCLTQQSYYKEQKTCQVVSMMTSHGQQNAFPHAPANEGGAHPSTPEVDRSLSVATNDEADQVSPNSVPSDDVPSPLAASTPPPTLRIDDTPPGAKQTCDRSETNKHPSCRKRLLQEPADTVKASLPDKDFQEQAATAQSLDDTHVDATINSALVGKTPVEKKRSRGASSMLRESG